uniref:Uncharacterized protein n=1 Tax=Hyaloperonospora arabidopsidis (strain Emoy2) TaxID=559515 RepID=M4B510_HYAAE
MAHARVNMLAFALTFRNAASKALMWSSVQARNAHTGTPRSEYMGDRGDIRRIYAARTIARLKRSNHYLGSPFTFYSDTPIRTMWARCSRTPFEEGSNEVARLR